MQSKDVVIGCIGQGYVGKGYADEFESRGYRVIRYAKEEPYVYNQDLIQNADVVFVAVPTPTTPEGFDSSIVREVLPLVRKGAIAVIKSTLLPGTTELLQKEFPEILVLHSPEFLSEKTAFQDVQTPRRTIIGIPGRTDEYIKAAELVMSLMPKAPFEIICGAREAEILKYANNAFFYTKVVFMNILYDLAQAHGSSWEDIRTAMSYEPWIGTMHIDPVHKTGRGAGGACFIKDFAAFTKHYEEMLGGDEVGVALLRSIEKKNIELLKATGKDPHHLRLVYGIE